MWRDDDRETTVKVNNGGGWSSNDVLLWLKQRQNGNVIERWEEWLRLR
jgi:hypothetical protein